MVNQLAQRLDALHLGQPLGHVQPKALQETEALPNIEPVTLPSGEKVPFESLVMYVHWLLQQDEAKHLKSLQDHVERLRTVLDLRETQQFEAVQLKQQAYANVRAGETVQSAATAAGMSTAAIATIASGGVLGIPLALSALLSLDQLLGSPLSFILQQVSGESKEEWQRKLHFTSSVASIALSVGGIFGEVPVLNTIITAAQAGSDGYTRYMETQRDDVEYKEKVASLRLELATMRYDDQLKALSQAHKQFYSHFESEAQQLDDVSDLIRKTLRNIITT